MLTSMILTGLFMTAMPFASAEEITVSLPEGSGVPGCENTNECYIPFEVTVHPGDTVVWSNDDVAAHTVTSGVPPTPDGTFDSGIFMAGTTFSHTFDTLGQYDYYCIVHPWMIGTVLVTVGGGVEKDLGTITIGNTIEAGGSADSVDNLVADIVTSAGNVGEEITIDVTVTDVDGNPAQHLTYNIQAVQGTMVLLNDDGHMHDGTITNTHTTSALTVAASDDTPVTVTISAVGFGHGEEYREVFGQIATTKVVPEFGTIAMMVLLVSIVAIVAITAKSKMMMPRI